MCPQPPISLQRPPDRLFQCCSPQELKLFSSNSTVEILSEAAQEAAALALEGLDADIKEAPSKAAEAPIAGTPTAEGLACPTCIDVEELPLEQWASEADDRNASAFRLPWGQDVLFEPVDYTGAAEVVSNCLSPKGGWESLCAGGGRLNSAEFVGASCTVSDAGVVPPSLYALLVCTDDTSGPNSEETDRFVERRGTQLQLGGKPFFFAGFHAGQLPQLVYTNRSAAAEALLNRAAELGFQASGQLCSTARHDNSC